MNYYPQNESDQVQMKNIFNALLVMIKIFFDLNAQVRRYYFYYGNDSRVCNLLLGVARAF